MSEIIGAVAGGLLGGPIGAGIGAAIGGLFGGGESETDRLLRVARDVVNQVQSQLNQLLNMVQEAALAPMRAMIQQVTGGIWRGRGADAFVQEVSTLMIPGVGMVGSHIGGLNGNIGRALNIVDEADGVVNSLANSAGDLFGAIF